MQMRGVRRLNGAAQHLSYPGCPHDPLDPPRLGARSAFPGRPSCVLPAPGSSISTGWDPAPVLQVCRPGTAPQPFAPRRCGPAVLSRCPPTGPSRPTVPIPACPEGAVPPSRTGAADWVEYANTALTSGGSGPESRNRAAPARGAYTAAAAPAPSRRPAGECVPRGRARSAAAPQGVPRCPSAVRGPGALPLCGERPWGHSAVRSAGDAALPASSALGERSSLRPPSPAAWGKRGEGSFRGVGAVSSRRWAAAGPRRPAPKRAMPTSAVLSVPPRSRVGMALPPTASGWRCGAGAPRRVRAWSAPGAARGRGRRSASVSFSHRGGAVRFVLVPIPGVLSCRKRFLALGMSGFAVLPRAQRRSRPAAIRLCRVREFPRGPSSPRG